MQSIRVGFGVRVDPNAQHRVMTVLDHPTYLATGEYAYDIALLVLEEPVRDRRPLEVGGALALVGGVGFTAVGYGRDATTNGIDVKKRLDTELAYLEPGPPIDDAAGTKTGTVVVKTSRGSTCSGDSGGALLRRGTRTLVGMTSWGTRCTAGSENGFPLVAPHLPWAREVLRACAEKQRFFPLTGIFACGGIAEAWEDPAYGGAGELNQTIGLPLATASYERNGDGTDRSYVAQWFERARVEHHPENEAPYDVGFGRLGAEVFERDESSSELVAPLPSPDCEWIARADGRGAYVCGAVLAAWHRGGGLRILGAPLSGERPFYERTDTYTFDGTAQWFERGRLERHDEIGGLVLGGKLGCRASGFDRPLASLDEAVTRGCALRLEERQ